MKIFLLNHVEIYCILIPLFYSYYIIFYLFFDYHLNHLLKYYLQRFFLCKLFLCWWVFPSHIHIIEHICLGNWRLHLFLGIIQHFGNDIHIFLPPIHHIGCNGLHVGILRVFNRHLRQKHFSRV